MGSPLSALASSFSGIATVGKDVVHSPAEHSRHRCINTSGPSLIEENLILRACLVYICIRDTIAPFENYSLPVWGCH